MHLTIDEEKGMERSIVPRHPAPRGPALPFPLRHLRALGLVALVAGFSLSWSEARPPRTSTVEVAAVESCVVVVHPDNPLVDISSEVLTRILRAEQQRWDDGTRIFMVLPPTETVERRILLKRVYRMDEKEFKKYWTHLLYRNKIAQFPKTEGATAAISQIVEKRADAIAVVSAASIPKGAKVRILTVDHKSPGDPTYLLRDEK